MAKYQLSGTGFVIRAADRASIPDDPTNRDYAEYLAWVEAGNVADPYVEPAAPPITQILSQDLMAQFTAADALAIKNAVDANPQFWLLWSAMQAQSEPMQITNDRFLTGWGALVAVLGRSRMAEIAAGLRVAIDL